MTATLESVRAAEGWWALHGGRRTPVAAWAHVRAGNERGEVVGLVGGVGRLELATDVIDGRVFYNHDAHLPRCRCAELERAPVVEELDRAWCESCPGVIESGAD